MADTPITWHPHTNGDPLTRLGQGTDTDISIMNSTVVTPPSRLRREHRNDQQSPESRGREGATGIDSQWPLKSMPVPKWRITIRAFSQRSASPVVDLSEHRNAEKRTKNSDHDSHDIESIRSGHVGTVAAADVT
ncbi:hypothetical protein PAAG_07171 [Paracoccidioides lutzii Pb01]|uniref:Uncharacterized protein n=1 Tax=Paracoccidioides lutzii (strain ATCC MYA-826 / Pb01) TaxID=502779 RepID=C1H8T0_PARBA|nr:hypothetical protein PAAG_07171 [Paracoccidioides lutzii Pb01]EEH36753.1 hypothetical protein PAAG_07171 [Paracoccidioides lutzii Pb01]